MPAVGCASPLPTPAKTASGPQGRGGPGAGSTGALPGPPPGPHPRFLLRVMRIFELTSLCVMSPKPARPQWITRFQWTEQPCAEQAACAESGRPAVRPRPWPPAKTPAWRDTLWAGLCVRGPRFGHPRRYLSSAFCGIKGRRSGARQIRSRTRPASSGSSRNSSSRARITLDAPVSARRA